VRQAARPSSSQHKKGAKMKFRPNPKENPFQSRIAAMPMLLKVMVKPMSPIMITINGILYCLMKRPGAGVTSPVITPIISVPIIRYV